MFYGLIKLISLAGVYTFFRRISPQHVNKIPTDTPVIFVSNHPNTMIDPLVVGTTCNRKIFFFAKSTLFNNPLSKWLLPKLQLVPVYRKQDDPSQINKNEDTFEKGFQILKNNGAFLIFPEGVSTGDRTLSKIKTGAARIGFGAMVKNNWELNVTMIPVGLSYSNAIKFKSNVIVRYGSPINLKTFQQQYDLDEFDAVNQLTNQIETALSKLTTNEVNLNIKEVKKPETNSFLVAENIAQQLVKRISYRRAMKRSMQSCLRLGAKGIKVSISGRLGGNEIARTEWLRDGSIPSHTLRADIDYAEAEALTTYGIIGIKVWIYKGEVFAKEFSQETNKITPQEGKE